MAEQAAEAKRRDMNLSVDYWKNKFLYPYGDIAPMKDNTATTEPEELHEENHVYGGKQAAEKVQITSLAKLISSKYRFPVEKCYKKEWLAELQKPLNVQADDILRDLYKFVKDFPVEIVPHLNSDELAQQKEKAAQNNTKDENFYKSNQPS